ncbi:metallophosphoesterase [Psychroserpens luteolus]|uniref:metallophosphoesterase n=1 Tax=Psychroserpens luteolus TaxID=2855840 RepID=UPI001E58C00D|nr:metallophosphoesterase [Psychroserpens luteolus]MCD2258628.1 metallophosphoesterase [Psychroserpens luteolus]
MPNPIYILQLSDWHLNEEISKKKEYKATKKNLIQNLKYFLNSKDREHLDILSITGDMMDRNGSVNLNSKPNHNIAIELIKDLSKVVCKDKITKIYCAPGNHDSDFNNTFEVLEKKINKNSILKEQWIPNYEIVDEFQTKLESSFKAYNHFCSEIGAIRNGDSTIGFDEFNIGNGKVLVSWFNTSWLSMSNKDWKNLSDGKLPIYPTDYENISVGNKINSEIYKMLPSIENKENNTTFSLSLFHHFPRLLNWHDKNSIEIEVQKKINESSLKEYNNYFKTQLTTDFVCKQNTSFYERISNNDLVLNGHTHGKLFDPPYYTSNGVYTKQSKSSISSVNLIEVDLFRKYFIIYDIPLKTLLKNNFDKINKRIRIFKDQKYIDKINSNYTNIDLYYDLKLNNGLSKTGSERKKETLMNLNQFETIDDEKVNDIIEGIYLTEQDLLKNPMLTKHIRKELQSLLKKV